MIIFGEKVGLRAIELTDKKVLQDLMNDPETEYNLGGWSFPVSELNQEAWIREQKPDIHILRCMIEERNDKTTVGTVILSDIDYKNGIAQIHIKLLKEYCGKGYGTDAIKAIVAYAFCELRLQCIYAFINEYNTPSIRLFEKTGFKREGKLRNRFYKEGAFHDQLVYSILDKEYGEST